jgi:hypothetical protein
MASVDSIPSMLWSRFLTAFLRLGRARIFVVKFFCFSRYDPVGSSEKSQKSAHPQIVDPE